MTEQDPTAFFFEVSEIVKTEFQPEDSYLRDHIPTFLIPYTLQFKGKVENLRTKLRSRNLDIHLQMINGKTLLQVIPLQTRRTRPKKLFRFNLPLVLFMATIITVTISGYLTSESQIRVLKILAEYNGRGLNIPDKNLYVWELTALYVISIMSAIGLHELGHTIACRIHKIEASLPIFLPGIPGITPGTFGAIIIQKEPAFNRNQLFDIGLAGPLIGFVVSIIVSVLGYSWSIPVTSAEYLYITSKVGQSDLFLPPLLFMVFQPFILTKPDTFTYLPHPVAVAGWTCTLITFLNAFPIGQLDGGHVSRAILGAKWHKRLSYVMIGVMILAGWWSMAILVGFLVTAKHPGTVDNVSDISKNRKIAGLLLLVILVSCFTFSPESPLLYFLNP